MVGLFGEDVNKKKSPTMEEEESDLMVGHLTTTLCEGEETA